jgi:hypothetical protein
MATSLVSSSFASPFSSSLIAAGSSMLDGKEDGGLSNATVSLGANDASPHVSVHSFGSLSSIAPINSANAPVVSGQHWVMTEANQSAVRHQHTFAACPRTSLARKFLDLCSDSNLAGTLTGFFFAVSLCCFMFV